MDTATLPRMTAPPAVPGKRNLSDEAAVLLGYDMLGKDGQKERDEARLFEACVACGIRPFQTAAVQAYMREKMAAANDYAAAGVAVPVKAVRPRNSAQRAILKEINRRREWRRPRHVWNTVPLKGYAREVPTGAVAMAVALKNLISEVEFSVYELVEQRQIDPFLSARLGEASFYIAVWDEPGFDVKYE